MGMFMKIDEFYLALVLKTTLNEKLVCIEHDTPHKTFVQYRIREDNGDTRSTSIGFPALGVLYKKYLAINNHPVEVKTYRLSTGIIVNEVVIQNSNGIWSISDKEEHEIVIGLTQQLFKGKKSEEEK